MLGATLALLATNQVLVPGACMHLMVLLACAGVDQPDQGPVSGGAQLELAIIAQAEAAGPMGPSLETEEVKPEADPECAWLPYQTPRGEYFILSVDPETSGTFALLPVDCHDNVTIQHVPSRDPLGYNPSSVPVIPGQVVRVYDCGEGAWRYLGEADLTWTASQDVQEIQTIKEFAPNLQCSKQGRNVPFPARLTVHHPR